LWGKGKYEAIENEGKKLPATCCLLGFKRRRIRSPRVCESF